MLGAGLVLILTAFLPDGSAAEGWTFDIHPLLYAGADATWNDGAPVLESFKIDFSTRLSALSDVFDVSATGVLRRDSVTFAALWRASAGVKWPGSPWIGTRIGFSDLQPYAAGLGEPVIEWGWMDIDSLLGFSAGAGGILGFSGDVTLLLEGESGDTLVMTGLEAPWLGFGTASWVGFSRATGDSTQKFSTVSAMLDLRHVEPWVVIANGKSDGRWGVTGRIHGWSPIRTRYGTIEIVPGMVFSGDSAFLSGQAFYPGERTLTLDLLHRSGDRLLSCFLSGHIDLEGVVPDGGQVGFDMVSAAGIEYRLRTGFQDTGDWSALLDADYRRSGAGGGASISLSPDSIRLFGRASYSPVGTVTAFLEVSGDLWDGDEGTLDPAGLLRVTAASGWLIGSAALEWDGSEVLFHLSTTGVLW